MDQLEKLKAQEAELEAQMLGNQEPEEAASATQEEGVEQTQEELEAAEYMEENIREGEGTMEEQSYEEESEEFVPEPEPERKPRTDWKKRFVGLQKSHEATIRQHEVDMSNLREQINELHRSLIESRSQEREVQGDIFDGAFTQEDEDTFGPDGMAVVKKATRVAIEKQLNPLKEQLKRSEEARLADIQERTRERKSEEYQQFLSRLSTLAPDYAELNADKGFLEWLSMPDDFSGLPRKTLLRQAEAARDVMRVADFFIAYEQSKSAVQRRGPSVEAKRRMVPTGTGTSAPPKNQQEVGYYRKSDINKFYSDVGKGRYKGQEDVIKATEAAIEAAYREGRILHGN